MCGIARAKGGVKFWRALEKEQAEVRKTSTLEDETFTTIVDTTAPATRNPDSCGVIHSAHTIRPLRNQEKKTIPTPFCFWARQSPFCSFFFLRFHAVSCVGHLGHSRSKTLSPKCSIRTLHTLPERRSVLVRHAHTIFSC